MDNELWNFILNKTQKKWLVEWDEIQILGGETIQEQDTGLQILHKSYDECTDEQELSDNEKDVSKGMNPIFNILNMYLNSFKNTCM